MNGYSPADPSTRVADDRAWPPASQPLPTEPPSSDSVIRADNDSSPAQEADVPVEILEATPAISAEPIDNEPSAPQQTEFASEVTVTVEGEGNVTFAARLQNFHYYSGDHVEPIALSPQDVAVCADERFIPPKSGLQDAADKLAELGIVILLAPAGSGRRTAALRLLCETRGSSGLYDLEAAWQRPNVKCLEKLPGGGFLLDLSEPSEKPAKRGFGTELLQWASQRKQQGSRIVIITTHNAWSGPWADEARNAVVEIGSPDAKALVERELAVQGVQARSRILDNPRYKPIWDSSPRAEDACRLAKLIASSTTDDPQPIIDQYQGWTSFFDTFPAELHSRIVLWSGALCSGGRRESVLRMSDAFIGELGDVRTPKEILGGDISSKRFASASITDHGDRVELDPGKKGLSSSVLRHFWQEFPTQHKRFVSWATSQAAELPADDAALVVDALVGLGIHYRAGEVFKQLRDSLAPRRRALAVRALSTAALDERFGSYMRSRLYTWLYGSPTQDVIDLVAEVCGGSFGAQMPGPALARLRLAGERSAFGSEAVSTAWVCLATAHPQLVRAAIGSWLTDGRYPRAGLVAFMALAGTGTGSALLLGEAGHELRSDDTHAMVVTSLRRALEEPDAVPIADSIIRTWAAQAEQGTLPGDLLIDLLGAVFAGDRYQDLKRFLPEEKLPDPGTFWHSVLSRAFYPMTNEAAAPDTLVRAG